MSFLFFYIANICVTGKGGQQQGHAEIERVPTCARPLPVSGRVSALNFTQRGRKTKLRGK